MRHVTLKGIAALSGVVLDQDAALVVELEVASSMGVTPWSRWPGCVRTGTPVYGVSTEIDAARACERRDAHSSICRTSSAAVAAGQLQLRAHVMYCEGMRTVRYPREPAHTCAGAGREIGMVGSRTVGRTVSAVSEPIEIVGRYRRRCALLPACLDSLAATLTAGATVQLVDDASNDEAVTAALVGLPLADCGSDPDRGPSPQPRLRGARVNAAIARSRRHRL